MKKFIYLVLMSTLLAIPTVSLAYAGENSWDPLYLKIEETQQSKNFSTESRLKNQYGNSAFYDCYPCTYKDTSNPTDQSICLAQTENCLKNKQLGTNLYNSLHNSIVTEDPDTGCKNNFGVNSYYDGSKNANGSYVCACKSGYKWDNNHTICVLDDKNGDCKNSYGIHSYWVKNGCDCEDGYFFGVEKGTQGLHCILDDRDDNCKKTYGLYSYWTGKDRECGCIESYQWNENQKQCIKKLTCEKPNILEEGICFTPDGICTKNYGSNSYFTGNYNDNNQIVCDCKKGYEWLNSEKCILTQPNEANTPIIKTQVIIPSTNNQMTNDKDQPTIEQTPETQEIDAQSTSSSEEISNQTTTLVSTTNEIQISNPVSIEKKDSFSLFIKNISNTIKNIFKKWLNR